MSKFHKIFLEIVLFACVLLACSTPPTPDVETTTPFIEETPVGTQAPTLKVLPPTWTPTIALTPATQDLPIASETTNPEADEQKPEGWGPDNFPPGINSLTGLPVFDFLNLERRPVAVKISNFPRGIRPQWGLSEADQVYEYYHEGGLTRFFAVFLSNDVEQVGPVRSARSTDLGLIRMYKAIFVYGSGDDRVRHNLRGSPDFPWMVTEYPAKCPPMCRIEPKGWNHLVTGIPEIHTYIAERGLDDTRQSLDGLYFLGKIPEDGLDAQSVIVRYSSSAFTQWEYHPDTGDYFRNEDKKDDTGSGQVYVPMVDRLTDEPVKSSNVVVLLVPHLLVDVTPEIVHIEIKGSGSGYVFRDGMAYIIEWQRDKTGRLFNIISSDGTPFPLKPGNTWFQLVGQNTVVMPEAETVWRFTHRIP